MTRQIKVGKIKIGGGSPVIIQSMTKVDTRDIVATVQQIKELGKAGCELIRVAVKDFEAVRALREIKKKIKIPVCADIHFDYRLAIEAINNGVDKIRLNPGNIHKEAQILEVAKLAKKRNIPIRVGVNSGSINRIPERQSARAPAKNLAGLMVKQALDFIKILEKAKFYDIIVSLKASDVLTTIDACREFSKKSKYPQHLGITAAGPLSTGIVKSSIGMGILLSEGIGDTIRVSLTSGPCDEVIAAKNILQALNIRKFGPEIISCPTCGRCQVDLGRIVKSVEQVVTRYTPQGADKKLLSIAIMGCEVNGPGEAKEADIGIACGKSAGVIFRKGKIIKRVKEGEIVSSLLKLVKS